jgi:hypothetical protein
MLQNETEWIVITNDDYAEIFCQATNIFRSLYSLQSCKPLKSNNVALVLEKQATKNINKKVPPG